MSKHLEHELDHLERQLLRLSAVVEESIQKALKAFEQRDIDLAEHVIEHDSDIDQMEVDLEEECLKVFALYQPVAVDLRFLVGALKINNDLERVGDMSTTIARCTQKLTAAGEIDFPFDFHDMVETALDLLRRSLDAFVRQDTKLAHDVRLKDRELDEKHGTVQQLFLDMMKKSPEKAEALLQIVWVSRALERVGDHAKNIAEDVIYMQEGDIVRHTAKKERRNPYAS